MQRDRRTLPAPARTQAARRPDRTALPDGDPGLFRIWMSNALFMGTEENYNGSFVGFVPEGEVPVKHLEEMLDWDKILRRANKA